VRDSSRPDPIHHVPRRAAVIWGPGGDRAAQPVGDLSTTRDDPTGNQSERAAIKGKSAPLASWTLSREHVHDKAFPLVVYVDDTLLAS
jgi:hypothetical protein